MAQQMLLAHNFVQAPRPHPHRQGARAARPPVDVHSGTVRSAGLAADVVVVVRAGTKEIFHMDRLLMSSSEGDIDVETRPTGPNEKQPPGAFIPGAAAARLGGALRGEPWRR